MVDNVPVTDAVADLVGRPQRGRYGQRSAPPRRRAPAPDYPGRATPGCTPPPGGSWPTWTTTSTRTGTGSPSSCRGFTLSRGVAGVSGLVLPAVLDTPAQRLYEQFGGHSKGRGLTPEVFDAASHARQHPLYPLPAFGVGASMAFDRSALIRIGGFDVALGPARLLEPARTPRRSPT